MKLDTGMGRLGTRDAAEATRVADAIAAAPHLELAGAMTHYATADEPGDDFLPEQLARFTRVGRAAARAPSRRSCCTPPTAPRRCATRRPTSTSCAPASRSTASTRSSDDPADHGLEPALELHSYVAEVKPIAPGESAGYGRRFVAEEPTTLATVPIGYGDGVRRALTNNADVLVGGRRRPLRRDGEHGQRDGRARRGGAGRGPRRRGGPDRRAGRRADPRRGVGAAP